MSDLPAPERRALRWDGTVTAGNLLTAVAMLVALLVWGVRLEGQVERGSDRLARLEAYRERDEAEGRQVRELLARLDAVLPPIQRWVEAQRVGAAR